MATYTVTSEAQRQTALNDIRRAPLGFSLTARRKKRSIHQNDRMWAMLTIVSREVKWHGLALSPEDWKLMFLESLGHEMRMVPNIAGDGLVNLGRSSSALDRAEFTALMDLIEAFAAERGVNIGETS